MARRLAGNDVVDLGDPMNARAHERPRFVARVCGEDERSTIDRSTDPRGRLWSFFAAKEAAFKLLCKLGPRPVFAHRAFVVDPNLAWVRHGGVTFPLTVEREGACLHAVTWIDGEPPFAVARAARPGADLGVTVRRLATTHLARRLRCAPAALSVVRDLEPAAWDNLGPPRLLRNGEPSATDLSLSHDGRFVAYAAYT